MEVRKDSSDGKVVELRMKRSTVTVDADRLAKLDKATRDLHSAASIVIALVSVARGEMGLPDLE